MTDGRNTIRKPPGYWNNAIHVDEAVLDFIREHGASGFMPTNNELRRFGYNGLADAISRKHGGYIAVAQRLGLSVRDTSKPDHYWDDFAHVEQEILMYCKEHHCEGVMPTYAALQKTHHSSLAAAIAHHRGYEAVAERLGMTYAPDSKSNNYWDDFAAVERELRRFNQAHGTEGLMPTHRELQQNGYSSLSNAIAEHEGIHTVARRLGWQMRYQDKPRGHWTFEALRDAIFTYIREQGNSDIMPTKDALIHDGRADLDNAITHLGGYPLIADKLGLQGSGKKPFHYWDDFEIVAQELLSFIALHGEIGVMPTQRMLQQWGRHDLVVAIEKNHGGLLVVARRLGQVYTSIERISARTAEEIEHIARAIQPLAESQLLSGAQIMVILRRAGLLAYRNQRIHRLNAALAHGAHDEIEEAVASLLQQNDNDDATPQEDTIEEEPATMEEAIEALVQEEFDGERMGAHALLQVPAVEPDVQREQIAMASLTALGGIRLPLDHILHLLTCKVLWEAFYKRLYLWYHSLPSTHVVTSEEVHAAILEAYPQHTDNEFIALAAKSFTSEVERAVNFAAVLPSYGWAGPQLRLHQADAAWRITEVLEGQTEWSFLLNADDPGMGKSATFLAAVCVAGIRRVLLIAPKTVADDTWLPEIQKCLPNACLVRTLSHTLTALSEKTGLTFFILHYEELLDEEAVAQLTQFHFDCLCLDEVHIIKARVNQDSSRRREVVNTLQKVATTTIGLTGTPLVNELAEPLSIMQTLSGSDPQFEAVRLQSHRLSDIADVFEIMLPYLIRRRKQEVLLHLPGCDVTPVDISLSSDLEQEMLAIYTWPRSKAANALIALRKLSIRAKLPYLLQRAHSTPKLLILTFLTEDVSETIASYLADDFPDQIGHINGQVSKNERQHLINAFREQEKMRILVGTVGTIGVGLTLFQPSHSLTAHEIIFADLPYTWAEFDQGIARLYREGQKQRVRVEVLQTQTRLVLRDGSRLDTLDQRLWRFITGKRVLSDLAIDGRYETTDATTKVRKALRRWLNQARKIGVEPLVIGQRRNVRTEAQHWRCDIGRLRTMSAAKADEIFADPVYTRQFLDHLKSSAIAQASHQWLRMKVTPLLRPDLVIVDMGCGLNPFADLPCTVIGLDRHDLPGQVRGKMENPPLLDASADVLIYSLSLYGTAADLFSYFHQATRVLRGGGHLFIVEPTSSFTSAGLRGFVKGLHDFGFEQVGQIKELPGDKNGLLTLMHFTLTGKERRPIAESFERK